MSVNWISPATPEIPENAPNEAINNASLVEIRHTAPELPRVRPEIAPTGIASDPAVSQSVEANSNPINKKGAPKYLENHSISEIIINPHSSRSWDEFQNQAANN